MVPLSVTVPAPVLFKPTAPASAALAAPACMSKLDVLVKLPLAIVPPVCCTPATVLLKLPKSNVPPVTTKVLLALNRSAAPKAKVPAFTVVTPV